jgi:hypothetical protein
LPSTLTRARQSPDLPVSIKHALGHNSQITFITISDKGTK